MVVDAAAEPEAAVPDAAAESEVEVESAEAAVPDAAAEPEAESTITAMSMAMSEGMWAKGMVVVLSVCCLSVCCPCVVRHEMETIFMHARACAHGLCGRPMHARSFDRQQVARSHAWSALVLWSAGKSGKSGKYGRQNCITTHTSIWQ